MNKFYKGYRSILCLDGDLPKRAFFNQNLPIIAADGAADTLYNMDIKPDVIIGDLDSLDRGKHKYAEIIQIEDQNYNDFQKALKYIEDNDLSPPLILGVNGGCLDHILNNINIVLESDSMFYCPPIIGYTLRAPTKFKFNLEINTKISLFGMSNAVISTTGLKWNLDRAKLEFPGVNSSLNRTAEKNISITVSEGNLLLLIYETKVIDEGALA